MFTRFSRLITWVLPKNIYNSKATMDFKLGEVLRNLSVWVPSVAKPLEKPTFKSKLLLTFLTLVIFFLLSNIPIFGILQTNTFNPFHLFQMVLASNHGTLMELGISPIFISSLFMQLLIQLKVVRIQSERDQYAMRSIQKVVGMILTYGEAVTLVCTGTFGSPFQIGFVYSILIVLQLVAVGLILLYLDEMLEMYGLGSAISLFVATSSCENVIWKCLSPTLVKTGSAWEFQGSVNALVHMLFNTPNKWQALYKACFRINDPNLFGLLVTIAFFSLITYLQRLQVNLPLESLRSSGVIPSLPIKLIYTSSTPIFMLTCSTKGFDMFVKSLIHNFPNSYFTAFLSPISYYINAPETLRQVLNDPVQMIVYFVFVTSSCAYLAYLEINRDENRAVKIAKDLQEQGLVLKIRSSADGSQMYRDLKNYIDTATILSGLLIGSLSVMADLMGSYISVSSILLTTMVINENIKKFSQQNDDENI